MVDQVDRIRFADAGHALGAEHLGADVVAVHGLETGVGGGHRARVVAQRHDRRIQHAARFPVRQDERIGRGVHLDGLGAAGEKPQHVDVVDQGFAEDRPGRNALGLIEARIAGDRSEELDLAELAGIDEPPCADESTIEAALETDLENDAGVACRADGSIGVG